MSDLARMTTQSPRDGVIIALLHEEVVALRLELEAQRARIVEQLREQAARSVKWSDGSPDGFTLAADFVEAGDERDDLHRTAEHPVPAPDGRLAWGAGYNKGYAIGHSEGTRTERERIVKLLRDLAKSNEHLGSNYNATELLLGASDVVELSASSRSSSDANPEDAVMPNISGDDSRDDNPAITAIIDAGDALADACTAPLAGSAQRRDESARSWRSAVAAVREASAAAKCKAPHCWAEYGTPCGNCPAEASAAAKPETKR